MFLRMFSNYTTSLFVPSLFFISLTSLSFFELLLTPKYFLIGFSPPIFGDSKNDFFSWKGEARGKPALANFSWSTGGEYGLEDDRASVKLSLTRRQWENIHSESIGSDDGFPLPNNLSWVVILHWLVFDWSNCWREGLLGMEPSPCPSGYWIWYPSFKRWS